MSFIYVFRFSSRCAETRKSSFIKRNSVRATPETRHKTLCERTRVQFRLSARECVFSAVLFFVSESVRACVRANVLCARVSGPLLRTAINHDYPATFPFTLSLPHAPFRSCMRAQTHAYALFRYGRHGKHVRPRKNIPSENCLLRAFANNTQFQPTLPSTSPPLLLRPPRARVPVSNTECVPRIILYSHSDITLLYMLYVIMMSFSSSLMP